ncbi:metallophosphoesterase [soil metagenome]
MLSPEGAAICQRTKTAVVADVHLGYEWARASGGDMVPSHSLSETIEKLSSLMGRFEFRRLVVAGDLTESSRPCPQTAHDVAALVRWLRVRGVELVWLAGNHDPPRRPPLPETFQVSGWTIGHGHRPIQADPIIIGHHHPAIRAEGRSFPCFLVGPAAIALPSFSPNAAGLDLATSALPVTWSKWPLRCLASCGKELLDLGSLADLRRRTAVKSRRGSRFDH